MPPKTGPAEPTDPPRRIISHTAILIMSVYLMGISCGRLLPAQTEVAVFLTGLAGVVAYFALDYEARRRRQQEHQRVQQKTVRKLERRMERHVESVNFSRIEHH